MALTTIPVELVTLDDGVTITVDDNLDTLTLTSTDADASVGPVLNLYRNSSSPADSDIIGAIDYDGRNDNSQDVLYSRIIGLASDVSDGTEDGALYLQTIVAGTTRDRVSLLPTEIAVNDGGIDLDFRIESDGKTHALFVDGGNNQVLFNTSSARSTSGVTASTQIHGTGYNDASLTLVGDMGANALTAPVLFFAKTRGSAGASTAVTDGDRLGAIFFNGADGTDIETVAASIDAVVDGTPGSNDMPGRLVFRTSADGSGSNTERMRIGSDGRVGIGTTSARSALDVVVDHATGYAITCQNDGNHANRYGIKIISGTDDGSGISYFLDFWDGDGTNVGAITQSGGTVSYSAFTANHPCVIPDEDNNEDSAEPAYPYGTLLETTSLSYLKYSDGSDTERGIIYNVQKSSGAYSKKVLGVYGGSLNQGPQNETNKHQVLILGDGHILCNNEKGNISVGDGICTSSTAGIGMKADKMAMIIGIAQEDVTFSGSETKLVAVQYGLQQFTPWTD